MFKRKLLKQGVSIELQVLGEAIGYGTNCSIFILTDYQDHSKIAIDIEQLVMPLSVNLKRAYQPYCLEFPGYLPLIKIVKTLGFLTTTQSYVLKGVKTLGDYPFNFHPQLGENIGL
jgi:hypothetical protein